MAACPLLPNFPKLMMSSVVKVRFSPVQRQFFGTGNRTSGPVLPPSLNLELDPAFTFNKVRFTFNHCER
jgi:hypothetical protein